MVVGEKSVEMGVRTKRERRVEIISAATKQNLRRSRESGSSKFRSADSGFYTRQRVTDEAFDYIPADSMAAAKTCGMAKPLPKLSPAQLRRRHAFQTGDGKCGSPPC